MFKKQTDKKTLVATLWEAYWPKSCCLQKAEVCKPWVLQQEIYAGQTS